MKRNYWPTTKWQAADPVTLKRGFEKLSGIGPIIKSEYNNINSIVVVKNGYIAYERYFNGFGPDDTHHVASITKSIISALIGIAIDKGFIKNAEQKVLDFFPEYVNNPIDEKRQEITILHLLSMTAPYPFEDWHEPLDKMCMQSDWVKYILNMLGQKGSVGTFKYSTAGAHLLSTIITRSTGTSAREFANKHLFNYIGMNEIPNYEMESYGFEDLFGKNVKGWVNDPSGNSTGGWGLTLTTRDMARFGFLYLNNGIWENKQIIPKEWIRKTIMMNANKYGYLWWLREEDGIFAYLALGDGGNVICCIPEKDMVVAIASEFIVNPSDRWSLIKEYIIPAVSI
ncbi:6-aminohexanoate hydrolase [Bacillus atrophaeus]|uniref:serine hydrolase domain-containing protein n=1 Tax=Bacillus atrophaeus TaxID=1452 RepID=UPI000D07AC18|nr:serine hydrolase [Bacillus atrophaeus]MCY8910318.1 beta-lactamase family protein [Bacillus atrophaeus]MEC0835927.1 serine hydrolase [Bacillus atrophaeus]MEC0847023.1 serine hydrolase [Bacillus atrophaeus]MEC0848338.1 serine hydrolase [Bacillus atrophaeus]MEC0864797.1 serine hydrolase [Bacillus atrophaeus]